ncbi:MAG: hypothetical protein ACRDN0_39135, partial [Trebonia sp.]
MRVRNTVVIAALCATLGAATAAMPASAEAAGGGGIAATASTAATDSLGVPPMIVPGTLRSAAAGQPPTSAQCLASLGVPCYSSPQVERAYDLPPLYARGLNGRGRTIVIVDPYGSPT